MSTGLSWEYSGSSLSGVPRAINEGVTVDPRSFCVSPGNTETALPLPTYFSAFGTGIDIDREYDDPFEEEDLERHLPTFTVSDGEASYLEDHSKWDESAGTPLASDQGLSVTPSTRRQSIKPVLKKSRTHRKKVPASRKHSLPSMTKAPLYSPNRSEISPYGLRATRNVTAKMNAIFQESLSASLELSDASRASHPKNASTSADTLEGELGAMGNQRTMFFRTQSSSRPLAPRN
ncbi:uncharacterized protein EV420DRAFT_1497567 [Desarmillaria tabescens]|uniref:Uncharacterized protein n=1 Tax=Armillaria tabescens TaxID=1929756 RepID=A0AA39TYD0_ARMTA|nr:uncharacterized protein EV420DRAFT_1497567 [Desarmillaria tabescens]KAK0469933.1 hypothetical protein EV420DRAFT_1497567 [Desarmillaria tabescens]